jgi:hypothetical protein
MEAVVVTWKLALLAFAGTVAAVAVTKFRKQHPRSEMSFAWLNEQERQALKQASAIDGPSIKWPINKIVNEHGTFNRHRLKQERVS